MNDLITLVPQLAPYAGAITAAAYLDAYIATKLAPPSQPTGWYAVIYKIINFIAQNRGWAANVYVAPPALPTPPTPPTPPKV